MTMKAKAMGKKLAEVPDDPYGAFAWFVSHCASGLYKELLEKGRTDTEARNAVIHCFLDFASGEACRMARREEREPDHDKWRKATDDAFAKAVKRTEALGRDVQQAPIKHVPPWSEDRRKIWADDGDKPGEAG